MGGSRRGSRPVLAPADLPVAERRQKALDASLRLLSLRERSAVELKQRLRDKGYDAETIVFVLDRLREQNLQSDERFAESFASSSLRSKGLSGRVVQAELRRRGIDKETAAQAATQSPEEEAATALEIARRRASRLGSYPPEVRMRRLVAFLVRRGYGPEVCTVAAAQALGEAANDTD